MRTEPVRVAMWSGPRNISTAMMRAFENRADCAVIDEPFYASYLAATGLDHPMRDAVLGAQAHDPATVVRTLLGPVPDQRHIFYQKQMTHHIGEDADLSWMQACRNVFLIRAPQRVLASYIRRRREVSLGDIGFVRQAALFEREADRLGTAPPVIDAEDVLNDPAGLLKSLCTVLGIAFSDRMLAWPAGKRPTDGVWAPAWYEAVEKSTGFGPPMPMAEASPHLLADRARPYYERLYPHRLAAAR